VNNAGLEGSVVLQKVKEGKDDFGFNAQTEKYENLIKAGVLDPTKVTRTALENAASVASLLVTTEAVVFEKKEKEHSMPPMPGGGMGDMGGMY
jgi:chaperonin GroEL